MNNGTKCTLIALGSFLFGAAAGGAGVYFYSKRYFEQKTEDEIQNMSEYYINKYCPEKGESYDSKVEEKVNDIQPSEEEKSIYVEKTSLYDGSGDEKEKVAYGNYYGSDSSPVDIPVAKKKRKSTKKKTADIEIVDQSVWDENPGGLESAFLVYYDADDVLVDEESEQVIEDKEVIKKMISEFSSPDDTVILQDNDNNVLYHITIERMAYNEIVANE